MSIYSNSSGNLAGSQNNQVPISQTRPAKGRGEWWFRLTAPREPENATFVQREAARRGRLASLTILFISLFTCLPLIQAFTSHNPGFLFTMVITLILNAFALFVLNRKGHLAAAGWMIMIVLDLGFMLSFLATPGGVNLETARGLDIMAEAVMVVVAFFPPRSVFFVMIINTLFIILWLMFGPHTYDIAQLLQSNPYNLFYPPVSLEVFEAVLAFLWVNSAVRAIADLDRSEEIVALERREISQQQEQLVLKQQLEDGVQTILQTHVKAANGDFSARAPLNRDNVLWQVAYSLNNLLARLQSNQQLQAEMNSTRSAISKLTSDIRQGKPIQLQPTGTALDELIIALATATNNNNNQAQTAQQAFPNQQTFPNQRPTNRPHSVSLNKDDQQWLPPTRTRNI